MNAIEIEFTQNIKVLAVYFHHAMPIELSYNSTHKNVNIQR